eukprot:CAMPEP_0179346106 /NCGR_PEP_ID=MMETSP0797-20121207/72400_1 /TAXON_ID=47934 /ORGANISM="Dinophysis acuminata, Strain DAEP01" /LENGTH=35 /DNA_ID= /DNA_START= /DNA_END= /DNA_ORIENTATION=
MPCPLARSASWAEAARATAAPRRPAALYSDGTWKI